MLVPVRTSCRRRQRGAAARGCPVCARAFDSRAKLDIHLRTHTGERPFACALCPYQACQMSTLTSHMRTHTGEKPFACPFCAHRARQKGSLNKHIRVVHGARAHHAGGAAAAGVGVWPGDMPSVAAEKLVSPSHSSPPATTASTLLSPSHRRMNAESWPGYRWSTKQLPLLRSALGQHHYSAPNLRKCVADAEARGNQHKRSINRFQVLKDVELHKPASETDIYKDFLSLIRRSDCTLGLHVNLDSDDGG
ncbi:zinc finger protein 345-like [Penaeus japonicus]|uniref:zinc finger protein 345-like n=1 Tax=Penaeus japonicus TaxID=27405 RepID=UPI001C711E2E|nr:zinc finger protein 345-like [Penaeus japonicus]